MPEVEKLDKVNIRELERIAERDMRLVKVYINPGQGFRHNGDVLGEGFHYVPKADAKECPKGVLTIIPEDKKKAKVVSEVEPDDEEDTEDEDANDESSEGEESEDGETEEEVKARILRAKKAENLRKAREAKAIKAGD